MGSLTTAYLDIVKLYTWVLNLTCMYMGMVTLTFVIVKIITKHNHHHHHHHNYHQHHHDLITEVEPPIPTAA